MLLVGLLGPRRPRPPGAPARNDDGLAEGATSWIGLAAFVAILVHAWLSPDHLEHHDRARSRSRILRSSSCCPGSRGASSIRPSPGVSPARWEPLGQGHAFASRAASRSRSRRRWPVPPTSPRAGRTQRLSGKVKSSPISTVQPRRARLEEQATWRSSTTWPSVATRYRGREPKQERYQARLQRWKVLHSAATRRSWAPRLRSTSRTSSVPSEKVSASEAHCSSRTRRSARTATRGRSSTSRKLSDARAIAQTNPDRDRPARSKLALQRYPDFRARLHANLPRADRQPGSR